MSSRLYLNPNLHRVSILACNHHFPNNLWKQGCGKIYANFSSSGKEKGKWFFYFLSKTEFLIKKFGCKFIISILCCVLLILCSCPLFLTGLAGVPGMPFTRMSPLRVLGKALRGNSEITWEIELDPDHTWHRDLDLPTLRLND